jgi:hypothetical protein
MGFPAFLEQVLRNNVERHVYFYLVRFGGSAVFLKLTASTIDSLLNKPVGDAIGDSPRFSLVHGSDSWRAEATP